MTTVWLILFAVAAVLIARRLGRIASAIEAQNAHYGIPGKTAEPAETAQG